MLAPASGFAWLSPPSASNFTNWNGPSVSSCFNAWGAALTRTRTGQVVCRYAEEKTTGNRWGFLASLRAEGQGRLRTATTVRSSDGGHWAACWRTAFTTVATVAQASA